MVDKISQIKNIKEVELDMDMENYNQVISKLAEKKRLGGSVFEASVATIAEHLDSKYITSLKILPTYFTLESKNFKTIVDNLAANLHVTLKYSREDKQDEIIENLKKLYKLIDKGDAKMTKDDYDKIIANRNEDKNENKNTVFGSQKPKSQVSQKISNLSQGKPLTNKSSI